MQAKTKLRAPPHTQAQCNRKESSGLEVWCLSFSTTAKALGLVPAPPTADQVPLRHPALHECFIDSTRRAGLSKMLEKNGQRSVSGTFSGGDPARGCSRSIHWMASRRPAQSFTGGWRLLRTHQLSSVSVAPQLCWTTRPQVIGPDAGVQEKIKVDRKFKKKESMHGTAFSKNRACRHFPGWNHHRYGCSLHESRLHATQIGD